MMDQAGVDRVVIVPPTLERERLDYAQEAVKRYPGRFAIMGRIALNDPTTARRFPTWREQPGARYRVEYRWRAGSMAYGRDRGLVFVGGREGGHSGHVLTTGHRHQFARIAERHSQLVLIIDHMGVSSEAVRNKALPAAIHQSVALAKYPNVSVSCRRRRPFPPSPIRSATLPLISIACSMLTVRAAAIGEPT